jgi:hypothetical protein
MSAPNPAGPQVAGPKKTSPWLFVLIGCGGLIVILGIALMAGGFFVFQKAKEAGLDPDMLRENPALAAAKMIAATNPDIEVVSADDDGERITFREKSTGKTVTLSLDEVKQGRIRFESDDGEEVVIGSTGEGEAGGFRMESSKGSYEIGASSSVDLPDWLPVYPGAEAKGMMKSTTPEGRAGTTSVTTSDPVERVMEFYQKALEDAGLKVNTVETSGATSGAMVSGESPDGKRGAMIMIGTGDEGTTAAVSYNEKD